MEKGIVVAVLAVMAVVAAICLPLVGGVVGETATKTAEDPPLVGGVFVEQAGEAAAKTAGEGLGNIARRAIHKADAILNGSSNCKPCSMPYHATSLTFVRVADSDNDDNHSDVFNHVLVLGTNDMIHGH